MDAIDLILVSIQMCLTFISKVNHLGETDRVRSVDDDDGVDDDLVGMIFFVSCFVFLFCLSCTCCYRCYILRSIVIIASIQFCHPSCLKLLHFHTLVSASQYLS